ncbi:MAG: hypothetical protein V3V14_09950 [Saprospiraceae bacterium]
MLYILTIAGGIILSIILTCLALLVVLGSMYSTNYKKGVIRGQSIITDKEVLELFDKQPDKMLNKKQLSRLSGLSVTEAGMRLTHLQTNDILKPFYTNSFKTYYTLKREIVKPYELELSEAPFMTLEDLLTIFKHYDYKIHFQELCLSTGLPVRVLKREMKYFEKEGIVMQLQSHDVNGSVLSKMFVLKEPYRSKSDAFLELKDINHDLQEIYAKEMKGKTGYV